MKKNLLFISVFCVLSTMAIAQNDVYFIPSKAVKEVTVKDNNSGFRIADSDTQTDVNYNVASRDVDEYNRRGSSLNAEDADSADLQSYVDEGDTYAYSKMIVRFHSPAGVMVSSPYYWDICYGNVWAVYYDGWAFGLPSWGYWSYAYDPWYYNHWWYRSCWDYTWGWYDPWWGASYWGWHHPAYWGWNRPYYGGWGFAHHAAPGGWGHGGYAPGFDRRPVAGGRRDFARNESRIVRGSAGGHVRNGGNNYRSMGGGSGNSNYESTGRGLSKSFRVNGADVHSNNATASTGVRQRGGSVNRSVGNTTTNRNSNATYNRSRADYQNQRNAVTNRSNVGSNTQSRSTTTNRSAYNTTTMQSRSYNNTSSSTSGGFSSGSAGRSGGGGTISSGGAGRSGGGGVSRGGRR